MTGCPATYQKLPGQQRVATQCHERMHAGVVSAIEAKTQVDHVGACSSEKQSVVCSIQMHHRQRGKSTWHD